MNGVNAPELDPVAEILLQSYLGTASHNRRFHDEWEQPMTVAAKAQYLRSISQALVNQSERLQLNPEYAEFGRLAFHDRELNRDYLVRSSSAVNIEAEIQEPTLFSVRQVESRVLLIVYSFHMVGLDLSVANTSRPLKRKRLTPSSPATFVGTWAFAGGGSGGGFDQGGGEAFDDLGDLGDEDGEVGEQG